MRVSYICGICVKNDAISSAVRNEISWLLSAPGHDAKLFAYNCDYAEIPHQRVQGLQDIVFNSFFQTSDVVVFHFGVFYPLFNLLPVTPVGAKKIVVFHNITPKECLPSSAHGVIQKSFAQLNNCIWADHVICDSTLNQTVLADEGINVESSVLPLAVADGRRAPARKPSFEDGVARIIFIGRFVQSKSPIDLLRAVECLPPDCSQMRIKIDFVGNINFSDELVVRRLNELMASIQSHHGNRLQIQLHGNAAESKKNQLLSDADLFVLPTRHEGFCVPVLEALNAGCRIVTYDNSNMPYITGGFADLVPTGDFALLGGAMAAVLAQVRSEEWKSGGGYENYCAATKSYCGEFYPEKVRAKFLRTISTICQQEC